MTDPSSALPVPTPGDEVSWVRHHLGDLVADDVAASPRFRGTQTAADAALATFDVTGYARRRNEVWPPARRGASGLSPWIRHGLLTLPAVWDAIDGPAADVAKFRDELLWQEYARHLYARIGPGLATPLRYESAAATSAPSAAGPWDRSMRCVAETLGELERYGWLVNQTRMWLASDWTVRHHADWRRGEEAFFAHLLDGSRAANRAGWQWTAGLATGRPYGFSRWQVRKRAPRWCDDCPHAAACPIEDWPDPPELVALDADPRLRHDHDVETTGGPHSVELAGPDAPAVVWLTAESLGDDDPALAANPDLPVLFVFDEALLSRLRLSGKRLVFIAERLAELATGCDVEVRRGDPAAVLHGRRAAVTFTPVPGWRRISAAAPPAEIHPWPWLRRPHTGSVASFSAWNRRPRRA